MIDKIKELIKKMEELSSSQEYEKANYVLSEIKQELNKEKDFGKEWLNNFLSEKKEETVKDTFDYIIGNAVRLSPDVYGFSDVLNLSINVNKRINELRMRDDYTKRKIIAEEMVCNEMSIIPVYTKKSPRYSKPNRAFLDIAFKVNPSICKGELLRREKVNLWNAIECKNNSEIKRLTAKIKELQRGSIDKF